MISTSWRRTGGVALGLGLVMLAGALLGGCQLVLDFSPLADGGADAGPTLCDALEPNDSADAALAQDPGTIAASVCPSGDLDYYGFTADGNQDVTLDLTFTASQANDLELELVDVATGKVLTLSTGLGGEEKIVQSQDLQSRLPAGTYAALVFGRTDSAQSDYSLELKVTGGAAGGAPDAGP